MIERGEVSVEEKKEEGKWNVKKWMKKEVMI